MRIQTGKIPRVRHQFPQKFDGKNPRQSSGAEFLPPLRLAMRGQLSSMEAIAAGGRVTQELVVTAAECLTRSLNLVPDLQNAAEFAENLAFLQSRSRGILDFLLQRFLKERLPGRCDQHGTLTALEKNFLLILSIDYARNNPGWLDLVLNQLGVETNQPSFYAPIFAFLKFCTAHIQSHLQEDIIWPDANDAVLHAAKEKSLRDFAAAFDESVGRILKYYADRKIIPEVASLKSGKSLARSSAVSLPVLDVLVGAIVAFGLSETLGWYFDILKAFPLVCLLGLVLGGAIKSFLFPNKRIKRLRLINQNLRKLVEASNFPKLAVDRLNFFDLRVKFKAQEIVIAEISGANVAFQQQIEKLFAQSKHHFRTILRTSYIEDVSQPARIFFDRHSSRVLGVEMFGQRIFANTDAEIAAAFEKINVEKIWKGELP